MKLDLHSVYNLIRIKKSDEWKTAFNTTTGHYHYKVGNTKKLSPLLLSSKILTQINLSKLELMP